MQTGNGLKPWQRDIILGVVALCLLGVAVLYQFNHLKGVKQEWERFEQKTVLPDPAVIKLATLGYDNIYADWLWLQSIQAFGMGWITEDLSTEPIYNYFWTLSEIDPQFISAYRFGNLIIADNRQDWELGQQLLKDGVHKNPNNYDLPYLGLYNAIWQKDDPNEARWFSYRLNKIDEAPNFIKRLGEYIERKSGRYDVAFEYNVRYYLEYLAAGNDYERSIIQNRLRSLLSDWYQRELKGAVDRYVEKTGEHPEHMEDLLGKDVRADFVAPTITSFVDAINAHSTEIDQLKAGAPIPEDLVASIVEESRERIVGLPPEPHGTWYLIHRPTRYYFVNEARLTGNEEKMPYIVAAYDLIDMINQQSIAAQQRIMTFVNENDRRPEPEDIQGFLGRDPLGGHYVYQPEAEESPKYGVYYSTAGRRIQDGREPRLGIAGPGPFPFSIEPQLKDHPVDRQWALEKGYLLEDGTELWQSAEEREAEASKIPEVQNIIDQVLQPQ